MNYGGGSCAWETLGPPSPLTATGKGSEISSACTRVLLTSDSIAAIREGNVRGLISNSPRIPASQAGSVVGILCKLEFLSRLFSRSIEPHFIPPLTVGVSARAIFPPEVPCL